MNIDFFAMAWQNSGMHWNTLVWCARDNEQYLKHYYGENVMHYGVSHDGFYDSRWTPGAGDGI